MNRLSFIALGFCVITSSANSSSANSAEVDYNRDIKPLLAEKCISCHGPVKQEADLRLDAAKFFIGDENRESVAVKGHPKKSLVIQRISAKYADERMPPEGEGEPLTAAQIKLLSDWIALGMPAPADEEILETPEDHWAYQKITRPDIPESMGSDSQNPIDLFISHQQEEHGLQPLRRAPQATLLRRVSLDVTGLPPTVEQLEQFQSDSSQAAYESIVDQLLASPRYGERWGRHWMDVWRYSDWSGYKNALRGSQRHIWHWRDWIIESLNDDKSYDQMVVEMLAGDEIAPLNQDVLRATGFLARNYHNSNRNIWLDATVEHTAKAFLGMTINCARCHDHKFDPIAQQEYYTFRAIFEPYNVRTDQLPGTANIMEDGIARVFDKDLAVKTYLYRQGNEKLLDEENPLDPDVAEILGVPYEVQPVDLPVESYFPALSQRVRKESIERAEKAEATARAALAKFQPDNTSASADSKAIPPTPPTPSLPQHLETPHQLAILKHASALASLNSLVARYSADSAKYQSNPKASPEQIEHLSVLAANAQRKARYINASLAVFQKWQSAQKAKSSQGKDAAKKKAAIAKADKALRDARTDAEKKRLELSKTDAKYTAVGPIYPKQSTGRRLALAQWIVHPENPLTARVAINHIWLRHFGTPLVDNVFDFGMRSPKPTHVELLDWLASELVESGWSMKHIHRLILTSETYQQASSDQSELLVKNQTIDKDNKYYWRANVKRLESEIVRDSVLSVADQLDLSMSGPDIDFEKGEDVPRRSLYFRHAYEKQMLMMTIFDAANPTDCYRRSPSIIPQQALALANSRLTFEASRKLAADLNKAGSSPSEFIRNSFLKILSREPTELEVTTCEQFLTSQSSLLENKESLTTVSANTKAKLNAADSPALRARENLIHVLLNHNDFISVR
ncbi:PSD1 and planctomycete cytochrome C domain-containing protein [Thalassoglobus polymorphus]|uniref:Planctomycete cytochrome C n=1 Tax=Thalassoglobus polymorphus TaxID=2527994 RepID=A0A517QMC8_9PLAN|nr:PSD1 and planctomycete cytochrome C domain-containing protein [Thalassoglobus polymorphus]QDT32794.1 Planctomycete cytochrome C [Thalassoglobus polymorphus]